MITQPNTAMLTKDVFEIFITILIVLMTIVFTGYMFFQVIINNKLLIALLNVDDEKGNLSGTNKYFAEVMISQLACIIVNLFIIILAIIAPDDWYAFKNNLVNK